MMTWVRLTGLCFTTLMLWVCPAHAQEFGRIGETTASGVPYRIFIQAGEPSVQVLMIGSGGTGIYEVGLGTGLTELLVLSGFGPSSEGEVTLRLYRQEGVSRSLIYEVPMEQLLEEPGRSPTLQDGDIFVVEEIVRQRFGWRDALQIVSTFASLALIALQASRLL